MLDIDCCTSCCICSAFLYAVSLHGCQLGQVSLGEDKTSCFKCAVLQYCVLGMNNDTEESGSRLFSVFI